METTVLGTRRQTTGSLNVVGLEWELGDLMEGVGDNLQRSWAWTLRFGTPPPILGISPTSTKITFGLSRSLENMSLDPLNIRTDVWTDLGMGYANNEFYLPIVGCPSVSELEPQLTDKLTLKGNRAKLLHVPLWNRLYFTNLYMIDDVTGEIYACHQDEIIAIKEHHIYEKKWLKKNIWKVSQGKGKHIPQEEKNSRTRR